LCSDNLRIISNTFGSDLQIGLASSSDNVNISAGNLKIGDGVPDLLLGGNSVYVQGGLEVDGQARFDGSVTVADSATFTGPITITYEGDTTVAGDLVLNKAGGATVSAVDTLSLSSQDSYVQVDDELVIGNESVGIGSISSSDDGLMIKSDAGSSGQVRGISLELDDAAGASKFSITNSEQADVLSIDSTGRLQTDSSAIAEVFAVSGSVSAGDVVVMSSSQANTLIKSSSQYQDSVVGVVTDDPAITLDSGTVGRAIALAGKVTIKVTNANGAIVSGDYLTTSSTAGVAMKATQAGPVVAQALENFNSASGTILAFVQVTWYDPLLDKLIAGDLPSVVIQSCRVV
jgi:hypothetical protein